MKFVIFFMLLILFLGYICLLYSLMFCSIKIIAFGIQLKWEERGLENLKK